MYGFGVVLLEMLTGKRTLDLKRPDEGGLRLAEWLSTYVTNHRKLVQLMDSRFEGQYSSKQAFQAAQLTVNCVAHEPHSRPSMKEVVETLEQILSIKGKAQATHGGGGSSQDRHHGRTGAVHQRLPRAGGEPRVRSGTRSANRHASEGRAVTFR